MIENSIKVTVTGLLLSTLTQSLMADETNFYTTDANQCVAGTLEETGLSGDDPEVASVVSAWESTGFGIGKLSEGPIYGCVRRDTGVVTSEQQAIGQAASASAVAVNASIIQNTNIFTRMSALREGRGVGFDAQDLKMANARVEVGDLYPYAPKSKPMTLANNSKQPSKARGGGASADQGGLLDNRLSGFINGNVTFGDTEATRGFNGFGFDTQTATLGADYRLTDNFFVGTAFGYTATNTNMVANLGGLEADGYSMALYSTYSQPKSFYIDGLMRIGWSDFNGNRNFSTKTLGSGVARSEFSGNDYSASATVGYDLNYRQLTMNPYARFDYVHNTLNSYREQGTAALASELLRVSKQDVDSMRSALGIELDYAISTARGVVIPTMRLEWQHEYMNDSRLITATTATGGRTQLYTSNPDRDFLNLGVGFSTVLPNGFSGFFSYDTMQANRNMSNHSFTGGIRMEF